MSNKYKFYHISNKYFNEVKNRNMLGSPIKTNKYKKFDYNDSISLFLGKPTIKDIELLRRSGFSNFGKPNDPLFIYELDLEPFKNKLHYIYLTSTREQYEFLRDNKKLSDDEFFSKRKEYYKKIGYKDEYNSLSEIANVKHKYENFSKDVTYQIQEAKKDNSLYELYAGCIPHIMLPIKEPIPTKLIETNQDNNIEESSQLFSESSNKPTMLIFGESHFNKNNINYINKTILDYKPDVILHELLDNQFYNRNIAKKLIIDNKVENDAGAYIKDILELIINLNCKAYGIDRRDDETAKSKVGLAVSFQKREEAMVNNIKKYKSGRTAVVVGDTHLRIKNEPSLGGISPIYKEFKNDKSVIFIRSEYREIDKDINVLTRYKENYDLINLDNKKPKYYNLKEEITEEHIKSTDPLALIKTLGYYTKIDRDFLNLFMERMVDNKHIKPKYRFTDEIELDKNQMSIFKISKTKIGRLIFNSFCLPQAYIETFGFVNEQVDSSVYDTIHNNLATLLLGKKITHEEYADVVNRLSWLGMTMTNFKGHCMDFDSITMSDKFLDHKNKVYKELIDKNASPEEVLKTEEDLLNLAKEEKKDTGLYKIIKSGSKGNFSNNFKNLNIGRGLIQMPDGKPKILTNSLAEGNKLSDYIYLSNNSIQGSFGRSLKTAQGWIS